MEGFINETFPAGTRQDALTNYPQSRATAQVFCLQKGKAFSVQQSAFSQDTQPPWLAIMPCPGTASMALAISHSSQRQAER
jgi:hypothetical protein